MVAPSFQTFEVLSEPFLKNGKEYIKVKNPKTGTIREVRNYTEKEYKSAYGSKSKNEPVKFTNEQKKFYWPAAVRSLDATGTNPRTLKASVAASSPALAYTFMWQAYGAQIQKGA